MCAVMYCSVNLLWTSASRHCKKYRLSWILPSNVFVLGAFRYRCSPGKTRSEGIEIWTKFCFSRDLSLTKWWRPIFVMTSCKEHKPLNDNHFSKSVELRLRIIKDHFARRRVGLMIMWKNYVTSSKRADDIRLTSFILAEVCRMVHADTF